MESLPYHAYMYHIYIIYGSDIWAKQVSATQKAFCLTYSRVEQKDIYFLERGIFHFILTLNQT